MNDLQRKRIESALADAGKIANEIDAANATLAEILDQVDSLLATLQAVRLGMIREADEAAAPPPEPAAGPWEPYSEEAYERMKDADTPVLGAWKTPHLRRYSYAWVHQTRPGEWVICNVIDATIGPTGGNGVFITKVPPNRIARIIPPKESEK